MLADALVVSVNVALTVILVVSIGVFIVVTATELPLIIIFVVRLSVTDATFVSVAARFICVLRVVADALTVSDIVPETVIDVVRAAVVVLNAAIVVLSFTLVASAAPLVARAAADAARFIWVFIVAVLITAQETAAAKDMYVVRAAVVVLDTLNVAEFSVIPVVNALDIVVVQRTLATVWIDVDKPAVVVDAHTVELVRTTPVLRVA